MPTYYCHGCASELGHLHPYYPDSPLSTKYQLDKFIKHTVPDSKWNVLSVFKSSSAAAYATTLFVTHLSPSPVRRVGRSP